MRPAPIPHDAVWPGARRVVLSAPNGDLTDPDIAPVEMVADCPPSLGAVRYSARCMLEPGDLEKLVDGGHVWVSFYGRVPPFCVDVTDKDGR
ncbi:hypothetical protein [Amycolatopsis sp. NPDC051372]|uniref:hypothetical protein n=1 Tax=Amycolatopsis sp. NPDC051372 TaxID=3155669 RepID=UPI0034364F28